MKQDVQEPRDASCEQAHARGRRTHTQQEELEREKY